MQLVIHIDDWFSVNAAFLAVYAARNQGSEEEQRLSQQYAEELMETLVGVRGQGYVVGVGRNSPKQVHHQGR